MQQKHKQHTAKNRAYRNKYIFISEICHISDRERTILPKHPNTSKKLN